MKLLIILAAFPALALQQCFSNNDSPASDSSVIADVLYKGEQQFSLNMLHQINLDNGQSDNIFFSPFSIYNAMMLAYFISANQTEESLKKALFLPESVDKSAAASAYKADKYFRSIAPPTDYDLLNANRLFVSDQLEIKDCMKSLFSDEITPVNFKAVDETTDLINKWVANGTKDQIKDMLSKGDLSADAKIALVNAAYFKGTWKLKFPAESTRNELFYMSSSENAFVSMMKRKGVYQFMASEELGAHILELPYKGDNVSMYIFLPPFASPNGLTQVLERFTFERFNNIIENGQFREQPVEVYFPKFQIEQELELGPALSKIGFADLFSNSADLSQLTGKPELQVNNAKHKAKIRVDEEGTTAAGATVVSLFRSRPLDPVQFKCNHPFIYLLYDRQSKSIIFMGVFNRPPSPVAE